MHVDATVLMLPIFRLQGGDQFAKRLSFISHHVGQQQTVEQSIPLRQVSGDSDAAGLLSPDKNVLLQHQVADILEADAVLVQLAPVFRGDAVQHLCRIERPRDIARPSLSPQQPFQQDGEYLVRVHHVAMLVHRADAIRVAVGDKAGIAFFSNDSLLRLGYVRQNRLRVDAWKCRIQFAAHLDKGNAGPAEDARDVSTPGAVHRVNQKAIA